MRLIICRTRQVVGCNIALGLAALLKVSMPHAAGGRLQQLMKEIHMKSTQGSFNAARGRWSVATQPEIFPGNNDASGFQCRTRQVVGCNVKSALRADGSWFQCRTRQVVGCNEYTSVESPNILSFNAARGKWSVATSWMITSWIKYMSFNAARGKWSVATIKEFTVERVHGTVSMPHAASGRLQPQVYPFYGNLVIGFNAARGKWSVAT